MKKVAVLLGLLLAAALPLRADNIFQMTAQGKKQVIQRDAIVIHNDSSFLVYKHFDLKEQRVEKVRLAKGSLPYVIERSSPQEQKAIVATWRQFGFSANVIDDAGKITRIDDAYIDFYPPGGRGSLLESIPATTSFTLLTTGGAADEVKFEDVNHVDLAGDHLIVTKRDGTTVEGRFLIPSQQPAEARLLGITNQYDPASEDVFDFSMPLGKLKSIHFK